VWEVIGEKYVYKSYYVHLAVTKEVIDMFYVDSGSVC
jgi:hypothetical protein